MLFYALLPNQMQSILSRLEKKIQKSTYLMNYVNLRIVIACHECIKELTQSKRDSAHESAHNMMLISGALPRLC